MTQDQKTPKPPAASAPTASARRFLAQLMEFCFREGWRTPDDFVKYFPAEAIMGALKSAPELRVAILATATGIYEEILRRKAPALAAEDLAVALDEGTTSSQQLLAVFSPEDRVRYLDPRRIWDFLAEDQFWRLESDATETQRQAAAERMSFTLMQAVQERLLTLRDILEGVTYEVVADSLSPNELRTVVRHALVRGRDGIGLNEKVLLEVLPLDKLMRSMSLEHIWTDVVVQRLAIPCGFTDPSREERRASQSERPASDQRWSTRPAGPPPLPPELVRATPEPRSAPPLAAPSHAAPPLAAQPPPYYPNEMQGMQRPELGGYPPLVATVSDYREEDDEKTTAAPPVSVRDGSLLPPPLRPSAPPSSPTSVQRAPMTDDFNRPLPPAATAAFPPLPSSPRAALPNGAPGFDAQDAENMDRQRQRVTEHLRAIGRLPPRHATMPASVLRSIDAMYALLPSATDDIQRKSVMRQAFSNEGYLRVALLGLIELMDSSVDTSDPVIQEAKIEALMKILLFEEQRRKENGRFPAAPFGAPRAGSSAPPPPSSSFNARAGEGYYYPSSAGAPPHVATQRPPPPVLSNSPAQMLGGTYPGAAPPLPNLPAEPRRRTKPPPLPPSYPRG
ncbi:MAG TPA: hypothetical protein VMG12_14355 [Polyangiaceae bacterium]|nr:hypothetical protein [Polyangiaceae bacterium]